jgi:hypothetical protein
MFVQRQTHNIEIYRDDTIYEELTVLDEDDNEVDLTGYAAYSQIRTNVDGDLLMELVCEITDATNGVVTVRSAESTRELYLGPDESGVWDMEILTDDATPIRATAFSGTVTFTKDVTVEVMP